MADPRLLPADNMSAAAWIAPRLSGGFASRVGAVVPSGFEAYARILHSASSADGEPTSWGTVATAFGTVEHALMQFHALARTTVSTQEIKTPAWSGSAPNAGDLDPDSLAALLDVLSSHTDPGATCWFCLWEGYGWIAGATATVVFASTNDDTEVATASPQDAPERSPLDVSSPSRVELPGRKYLLYIGPLDAAVEMGDWPIPGWFLPQSPNIFWSDDVSWCVATEIDLPYTYVGGSRELIDDLLIDVRLEVWEAQLDDPIAFDTDQLNR